MSAYLPVSLVYLSVCMPVFLSSCVHSCLSICLPVSICLSASLCLSVCLSACLSVSLSLWLSGGLFLCKCFHTRHSSILLVWIFSCLPTYKLACWPSCLPVFLPACLQVWLPTFLLRAYLPANRFALKRSIPATYILGINILETQYHVFNVELDPMR